MQEILGLENINESLSTHYTIYKITNNINGKYYIGQHKTTNVFDNYMGSGKLILEAENKYGLSAFTKEILFDFDNFDDMNNKEIELVQLSNCFPYDQMSYNLKEGGNQGQFTDEIIKYLKTINSKENNPFYGKHHSSSTRLRISKSKKGCIPPNKGQKMSETQKQKLRKPKSEESKIKNRLSHLGKHVSTNTKQKLSKANSGKNNPAFGRKWMYNPITKEKVYPKKDDVQIYLDKGFIYGTGKR